MSGPLSSGAVTCRFCRGTEGELVLDMGRQPACDHFPPVEDAGGDPVYPLRMWLCGGCGLAQLAEDPTVPDEPRGVEPIALVRQAAQAVAGVADAGLLPASGIALEHGSPHGGSWLGLLANRGVRKRYDNSLADVVVDSFGLMHDGDQAAALALRAEELAPDGLLLVQFHSLAAVLRQRQWNAVRHGHPVYLSTPTVVAMLRSVGLETVSAWRFDLYGGTVLLAARRGGRADLSVRRLIEDELAAGVADPEALRGLARSADETAQALRRWLVGSRDAGRVVLGYGAASRAVPLLNHAGIGPELLSAVADASPPKQGRRFPGVSVPIIPPEDLLARRPDEVVLFVPDMLDEIRQRFPEIEQGGGRWVVLEPAPRAVDPAFPLSRSKTPARKGITQMTTHLEASARGQADEVRDQDLAVMVADLDRDLRAMSGRRLLITGGAGFLGYYLVQVPLAWNDAHPDEPPIEVTVFDNYFRGAPAWLSELGERPDVELRAHDVREPLPEDMGEFAFVIHAAGIATPTYYRAHPIETMDANITGLRNLLEYARKRLAAGRDFDGFLFFSSSEIYGDPDPEAIPTPETYRGYVSCTGPRACYDESKRYGETLCVNFAQQHGVPVRMARPFNNYGPGMKITDGRVIADLCRDALAGRDPALKSDGSPRRTFCYVSDAVTGYYLALLRGTPGEPYNIGIDRPEITMLELAETTVRLAEELFGTPLAVTYQASTESAYLVDNPNRRCPSIGKAREQLGYEPKVGLEAGMRRTLLWYAGNQDGTER